MKRVMKRVMVAGISILLFTVVPTLLHKSQAQTPTAPATPASGASTGMVTPFQLVSLAYQGYFRQNGVPSGNSLVYAYRRGLVVSENLVQIAVQQNRVPADTLGDVSYLQSVDRFLRQLANNNDRG